MKTKGQERRVVRMETRESQEMVAWARQAGLDNEYLQLGKGSFEARRKVAVSKDFLVAHQYFNRRMVVSGALAVDCVLVLRPCNSKDKGTFQGERIGPNSFAVVRPGHESTYCSPPDLRMLFIYLPAARLRRLLQATQGADLESALPANQLITLPAHTADHLTSLGDTLLDAPQGPLHLGPRNIWLSELEEQFVVGLTDCLTDTKDERGEVSRSHRLRYVDRAREFIAENYADTLGLESLASAVGVSPRTIEYSFRDILDTTPVRYIKSCRLRAARRKLLREDPSTGTVTDVALRSGFDHLSYFAADYRALFGEHPSDTLRRAN